MVRKLVPALVAPLLVLGACAKQADGTQVLTGDAAIAALRAAPEVAAEAGSSRFEMTMTFEMEGQAFEVVATGGFSGDQAVMEMDLGSMFADLAAAEGEELPPGMDQSVTMVFDGSAMYVRFPMFDSFTGGSKWLTLDLRDLGLASDSFGLGAGGSNPAQMLEALRGVADDIEELGQQDIRGVSTSGYSATIDLARALEHMPAELRDLVEPVFEQLGDARMSVQVWIDAEGLPRRLVMDMSDMFDAMGMPGGSASATMDFFDYGTPVDIEIPDPSETVSFMDVMGDLGMDAAANLEGLG